MYQWQISLTTLALLVCACNHQATGKIVPSLNLEIWQNDPKRPLNGANKVGNQLGFATIDFTLENTSEKPVNIKIKKIEIRSLNPASNQPLMSLPAKNITLGGLEYAPVRYQLSNKDGYRAGQVEAIIVYELHGKEHTLRSAPVFAR